MNARSLLFLLLSGCQALPPATVWVAPLAGQTGIPSGMPLVVHTGPLDVPPDYALPDLVRVVDLADGGFVAGRVAVEAEAVRFIPDGGWAADRDYAWVFDAVEGLPHGPSLNLPEFGEEPPRFSTAQRLDFLASVRDDEGRICLITSRPVLPDDEGAWSVAADGVDVAVRYVEWEPEVEPEMELESMDPGVDALCLVPDAPVDAGAELALTWATQPPIRLPLLDATLSDAAAALRGIQP